jgi:hypothetical protein
MDADRNCLRVAEFARLVCVIGHECHSAAIGLKESLSHKWEVSIVQCVTITGRGCCAACRVR